MPLTQDQILSALRTVKDPELHKDIVTLNMVKLINVSDTTVRLHVQLNTPAAPAKEMLERDIRAALAGVGVTQLQLEFAGGTRTAGAPGGRAVLPQVKNDIAVGAGKGGVGKSTLAVNIAIGLQRQGAKVGLMDGDVYGPSMPTLLGIRGQQPSVRGPTILPFHVHGIYAMTIGALVEQEKPLIWRGPMAQGAFKQLLSDNTEWPELDYMIVDLPPGTGDVPLTLCQLLPLTGAVIVATPQQVALDDAIRAIRMFQQLQAPILGMVENMSYIPLPDGTRMDLFGTGGAERAAKSMNIPFLGALPMYTELRVNSDAGQPVMNFTGDENLADALINIVTNLTEQVKQRNQQPAGPELNIM
jgi:ATP-binding protein involved in chromosome partitioning